VEEGSSQSSATGVKKYFLYALGEIILVVLGILFALQINNWNIRQGNQQVLLKSYEQLIQTLETDIQDLDRVIEVHTRAWSSVESYLNQLLSKDDFDNELLRNLRSVTSVANYKPRLSSFEAIKLNGLELIENVRLKDQLFWVYEEGTDDYKTKEADLKHILQTYINPFISKNTKVKGGNFKTFELSNFADFANDPVYLGNTRVLHIHHFLVYEAAMKLKAQILLLQNLLQIEKEKILGRSKSKNPLKQVNFALRAHPEAKNVFLTGTFADWNSDKLKMQWKDDHWTLNMALEPSEIHFYKFVVDGNSIHDLDNPNRVPSDALGGYNSYLIP